MDRGQGQSGLSVKHAVHGAKNTILVFGATLTIGCSPTRGPVMETNSVQLPFLAVATIQDLMNLEIDPSADFIWESVGTVVTASGTEQRQPRTNEQWTELRRKVIRLVEATNLLLIPGGT